MYSMCVHHNAIRDEVCVCIRRNASDSTCGRSRKLIAPVGSCKMAQRRRLAIRHNTHTIVMCEFVEARCAP